MDGNQKAMAHELWEKATMWADKIQTGNFSHAEAWFSLQFFILKSLEYPIIATNLSKAQCD
jgi:hypothetical protein